MEIMEKNPPRSKLRPLQIVLIAAVLLEGVGIGTYAYFGRKAAPASSLVTPASGRVRLQDDAHAERWRKDLRFFSDKFSAVQADFATLYPPEVFWQDVRDLDHDIPYLKDSEIILQLMKIVASARVAHNDVDPQDELQFHDYPVQFSWFADGPWVTHAAKEYKSALGSRIVRIGSMTPEQFESAAEPYISHENQPWLHALSPEFMLTREVAEHFGLAAADGTLEVTFSDTGKDQFRLRIAPMKDDVRYISASDTRHVAAPLSRQHPDAWYWYEYLPAEHALYVQYNRCHDNPKKPFKRFSQELFKFADELRASGRIERVIVDLRFNSGGNSGVIDPLIDGLLARRELIGPGRLYALMGRGTFSSGMMAAVSFRDDLGAILVGEPAGSRPNEYGEVSSFVLPNSKIEVHYTSRFFRLIDDSDPMMLEPDLFVPKSSADFLNGRDPVLETALRYQTPGSSPASVLLRKTSNNR